MWASSNSCTSDSLAMSAAAALLSSFPSPSSPSTTRPQPTPHVPCRSDHSHPAAFIRRCRWPFLSLFSPLSFSIARQQLRCNAMQAIEDNSSILATRLTNCSRSSISNFFHTKLIFIWIHRYPFNSSLILSKPHRYCVTLELSSNACASLSSKREQKIKSRTN